MARNRICELLGIDYPIVAFTHCRDVAIEVSKAGGLGVLGASRTTPDSLKRELSIMEAELDGKPFGVDVLMPSKYVKSDARDDTPTDEWGTIKNLEAQIPPEYIKFRDDLCKRFGVTIPADWATREHFEEGAVATRERSMKLLDVALENKGTRFLMNALGAAEPDLVQIAHSQNVLVGGLVGHPKHVQKHIDVGEDLIAAVGSEAGGHTQPNISTMVLVPEVVDAAAGRLPVLAGGGIGSGRQLAAAMCLGASGAWCGSVWLTTHESDVHPVVVEQILAAESSQARLTRYATGKSSRILTNPWIQAWEESGLEPLPMPLMALLNRGALIGAHDQQNKDVMWSGAGQIIGMMSRTRSVRDVVVSMVSEFVDTVQSIDEQLANF